MKSFITLFNWLKLRKSDLIIKKNQKSEETREKRENQEDLWIKLKILSKSMF